MSLALAAFLCPYSVGSAWLVLAVTWGSRYEADNTSLLAAKLSLCQMLVSLGVRALNVPDAGGGHLSMGLPTIPSGAVVSEIVYMSTPSAIAS